MNKDALRAELATFEHFGDDHQVYMRLGSLRAILATIEAQDAEIARLTKEAEV